MRRHLIWAIPVLGLLLSFGCKQEQPPVCAQYVQCLFPGGDAEPHPEVSQEDRAVVERYFGEDGQCWREADLAPECETACEGAKVEFCNPVDGGPAVPEAGPCATFCE